MSLFPEEPLDSPVGYFPAQLNQTLNNGRWTLIRKLGWGSRSSCWLATDSQDPDNIEAIKIYNVSASKDSSSANERDVLQKMWDSSLISCVPLMRDSFYEESERGSHFCLVLSPLGPSVVSLLGDSMDSGRYLALHIAKKVVDEVLEVLCSLHKNNIVHGGTFTTSFYTHITIEPSPSCDT
jgi:serine/threonine-protein kinase SRPK3